jgi:hypothetical protein
VSQVITVQILSNVGPSSRRWRWLKYMLFCLPIFVLSCATLQRSETAALPLTEVLPAVWSPLRDVEEVNIDGDAAPEYLLLFTYDTTAAAAAPRRTLFSMGSSTPAGPIGAVIYDGQVVTGTTPTVQVSPDRPTTAFVPYAILPSYRAGAGMGYVAEPTQSETINAYAVSYRTAGQSATAATAPDTVILLGGTTYLTFAWWQNRAIGYGVTQLYGPGGFEETLYQKFDWTAWQRDPAPIRDIIAVHPLHDRNLICRRFRYVLDEAALASGRPGTGAPLLFQKSDLGLHFCTNTPGHPFYPEGVVLAYLLEGSEALLDTEALTRTVTIQPNQLSWLSELIQNKSILRVDDLASYTTLTANRAQQPAAPLDTIKVCAVLTVQPTAGASSVAALRQGLLFTLRHEPAGFQPPTPDQLFIQTVEMLAAPVGAGVIKCEEQLGG